VGLWIFELRGMEKNIIVLITVVWCKWVLLIIQEQLCTSFIIYIIVRH